MTLEYILYVHILSTYRGDDEHDDVIFLLLLLVYYYHYYYYYYYDLSLSLSLPPLPPFSRFSGEIFSN